MPSTSEIDDLGKWIICVDRRYFVIKAFLTSPILRSSEVASSYGRTTQNINRAMHELEKNGIVECLMPEKLSWKKYALTDLGAKVLKKLQERNFL